MRNLPHRSEDQSSIRSRDGEWVGNPVADLEGCLVLVCHRNCALNSACKILPNDELDELAALLEVCPGGQQYTDHFRTTMPLEK